MKIDISSIKEDKPVKIVLLMEYRHINLVFFYKTNKRYIEVKQLYYTYSGSNYIDKSIIEVDYQKTGFGYRKFFKCPHCGKKRKYLYPVGIGLFACRDCIERNVYAYRTNIYDENIENIIKHKIIMKLLKLNFDLNLISTMNINDIGRKTVNMLNLLANIPDKPKHMRWDKYALICKQIHFLYFIYLKVVNGDMKGLRTRELNDMLNKTNVEFTYDNILAPINFKKIHIGEWD
ncbi:hypothetical protein ACV3P1_12745 [Clostridium perfringens]|uniref:hypothetical protein n=1 Tax=Clostridium perfringens TaxID=1502 RepID=UPI0039E7B4E0